MKGKIPLCGKMTLSEMIDTTDGCTKYDNCAKKLVSHKAVLAWILKYCAKEFAPYSIEYITDHCIEGDAEISLKAVDQDVKNLDKEVQNCPADGRILTGRKSPNRKGHFLSP